MKMLKYILMLLAVSSFGQTITNAPPFTIQLAITQGTNIYPTANGTNFLFNFGITNARGYFIYQTVLATNDVFFTGFTNAVKDRIVSVNVFAFGGDRRVGIPTNLPHLNTNGFALVGSYYSFTLTNGNEFIITLRTNIATMSTISSMYGQ